MQHAHPKAKRRRVAVVGEAGVVGGQASPTHRLDTLVPDVLHWLSTWLSWRDVATASRTCRAMRRAWSLSLDLAAPLSTHLARMRTVHVAWSSAMSWVHMARLFARLPSPLQVVDVEVRWDTTDTREALQPHQEQVAACLFAKSATSLRRLRVYTGGALAQPSMWTRLVTYLPALEHLDLHADIPPSDMPASILFHTPADVPGTSLCTVSIRGHHAIPNGSGRYHSAQTAHVLTPLMSRVSIGVTSLELAQFADLDLERLVYSMPRLRSLALHRASSYPESMVRCLVDAQQRLQGLESLSLHGYYTSSAGSFSPKLRLAGVTHLLLTGQWLHRLSAPEVLATFPSIRHLDVQMDSESMFSYAGAGVTSVRTQWDTMHMIACCTPLETVTIRDANETSLIAWLEPSSRDTVLERLGGLDIPHTRNERDALVSAFRGATDAFQGATDTPPVFSTPSTALRKLTLLRRVIYGPGRREGKTTHYGPLKPQPSLAMADLLVPLVLAARPHLQSIECKSWGDYVRVDIL